ncbi:MAG: hypothetical protein ACI9WS_003191 [Paraglaciecola psychrophila]
MPSYEGLSSSNYQFSLELYAAAIEYYESYYGMPVAYSQARC